MPFRWLVEHLLAPNAEKFRGCECLLPETCFYKNGKPYMLVRFDEAFCLTALKQNETSKTRLNQEYVFKEFSRVVRERKADENGIFSQIYMKQM